jgi:hypothetical protein
MMMEGYGREGRNHSERLQHRGTDRLGGLMALPLQPRCRPTSGHLQQSDHTPPFPLIAVTIKSRFLDSTVRAP